MKKYISVNTIGGDKLNAPKFKTYFVEAPGGNYNINDIEKHYDPAQILEVGSYSKGSFFFKSIEYKFKRPCFDGVFIYTSDSRFSETYGRRPVHLHNRIE